MGHQCGSGIGSNYMGDGEAVQIGNRIRDRAADGAAV